MNDKVVTMEKLRIFNMHYREGNPIATDEQFDNMLFELKDSMNELEYQLFRDSLREKGGDVKHSLFLPSLDKCTYGTDDFHKFSFQNLREKLFASAKIDGMGYIATYVDGVVVTCSTIGDGNTGVDISHNAVHVLPNMLPMHGVFEVRGEFALNKSEVEKLGYRNARNGVVGCMKQDDVDYSKISYVVPFAYQILRSDKTVPEQYKELESYGFAVPDNFYCSILEGDVESTLKAELEKIREKDILVDGLVIHEWDYIPEIIQKGLPERMVAFKVNTEYVEANIIDMTIKTSKDGRLKGTATIEPVEINGTTIENVSIYNYNNCAVNGIGPGARVMITKAGEIIPTIVKVIETGSIGYDKYWKFCPSCGQETTMEDIDVVCVNPECNAQAVKSVLQFLTNLDILGAGETSLEKWGIKKVEDLFEFEATDRNGEKFLDNFLAKVMNTSKEDLLAALNWSGIGQSTLNKLFDVCDCDSLMQSAINGEHIPVVVRGVGEAAYDKIRKYAARNLAIVNEIVNHPSYSYRYEVSMIDLGTKLAGYSFCFTGKISRPRKEYEDMVTNEGGELKSVSKNLDYLVVGEKAGSKKAKAEELGVKCITEEEFLQMVK
jgi:DNA ligase (NAD+)